MIKKACNKKAVVFVTDLISSEGYEKLTNDDDDVVDLFNIDRLLLSNQSKYGNIWRNIIKLVFVPLQALRLRKIANNNPGAVFHAHTIYYMFLCWMARIDYLGRPQASEILLRTRKSRLYRFFAIRILLGANHIIVDSASMQNRILQLCGKESTIIQNWIDGNTIRNVASKPSNRENVASIRGFTPLYRISEIFDARERSRQKPRLHLIYPFGEDEYRAKISERLESGDSDLGRLSRTDMYKMLTSAKLAISIPMSDSSPRTVYEAIFCGSCVAVTDNPWIDTLPDCMRARLFVVNLDDDHWLEKALEFADSMKNVPYTPSRTALSQFDEGNAIQCLVDIFY